MAVKQFRNGRHPTDSTRVPEFLLVGLRSKTSLEPPIEECVIDVKSWQIE
jgi:hypothetical protein